MTAKLEADGITVTVGRGMDGRSMVRVDLPADVFVRGRPAAKIILDGVLVYENTEERVFRMA